MKMNLNKWFLLFLVLSTFRSHSMDHDYSGLGSVCGDTLQECVDVAADGDTVYLSTDGPIDESVSYSDKSISLIATEGYHPVFSEGHSVSANLVGGEVTFKGLTFLEGRLTLQHKNTSTHHLLINIKNNSITKDVSAMPVTIQSYASHNLDVLIENNELTTVAESTGQSPIWLVNSGMNNSMNVIAQFNHVKGANNAVTLYNAGQASNVVTHFTAFANQIHTKKFLGEFTNNIVSNELNIDLISNYITVEEPYTSFGSNAFVFRNRGGDMPVRFLNNTIINKTPGFVTGAIEFEHFDIAVGASQFEFKNNILQDYETGIQLVGAVASESGSNIFHNVSSHNGFSQHVSDQEINPLLNSYGRLTSMSPAIDMATTSVLAGLSLPYVDADGLYREKDGNNNGLITLDVGAFEYGHLFFQHVSDASSASPSRTEFDDASLNLNPGLTGVHVTHQFNVDGGLFGIHNVDSFETDYYLVSGKWGVHNTNGFSIISGSVFNVVNILETYTTFVHKQSEVGNFTTIDKVGLNNNSDKVLQVSQYYDSSDPVSNPHPVGVNYLDFNGRWLIQNLDTQTLPVDTTFHIYYQDESFSAWKHVVSSNNIHPSLDFATVLDHRLLNSNACAQIQVTPSAEAGVLNPSPVGVRYDAESERWSVYNEDQTDMTVNTSFHIIIHPEQIESCADLIFQNGF